MTKSRMTKRRTVLRPLRLPLPLLTLRDGTPLTDFFTGYIQWLIVYPLMVRNTQECCESEKGRYLGDSGRHFE